MSYFHSNIFIEWKFLIFKDLIGTDRKLNFSKFVNLENENSSMSNHFFPCFPWISKDLISWQFVKLGNFNPFESISILRLFNPRIEHKSKIFFWQCSTIRVNKQHFVYLEKNPQIFGKNPLNTFLTQLLNFDFQKSKDFLQ